MAPELVLKFDNAPCIGRLFVRYVIGSPSGSLPFNVMFVAVLTLMMTVRLLATGGLLYTEQLTCDCDVITCNAQQVNVPVLFGFCVSDTRNRQMPFKVLLS